MHVLFKRVLERSRLVFIAHYHCTSVGIFYCLVTSRLYIMLCPLRCMCECAHIHEPLVQIPSLHMRKQKTKCLDCVTNS